MSHREQVQFCKQVKKLYPDHFRNKKVVDVGSLDINGNNRRFFRNCRYYGIDIVDGKNVGEVGFAHDILPKTFSPHYNIDKKSYFLYPTIDTIISTECLEHDRHFKKTLKAMYAALKVGGLLIITAGGEGREEHGTTNHHAWCSPGTNDYYKNVTNDMFTKILPPELFDTYFINQERSSFDFQFFGIKK